MEKISGEAISKSHALSLFLRGVRYLDFYTIVEIQENKDDNTLIESVIPICKKEREFTKKSSTERKFRNIMRRVCEEDDWCIDKYRPFKRPRRQGDKYEELVVTRDHIRFKEKWIHVVKRIVQELDAKGRYFVVSYNRRVNNNESTDEMDAQSSFRTLFKDKPWTPISSTPR